MWLHCGPVEEVSTHEFCYSSAGGVHSLRSSSKW